MPQKCYQPMSCSACINAGALGFEFSFALLCANGIDMCQGYYFARPGFQCLPVVASELFDLQAQPAATV